MNYQTFEPDPALASIVKFYWTLEVPFDENNPKQKIIPDGCIEMTFNLGDNIKKYISKDEFVIHPNATLMGPRTKSFYLLPAGNVDTFAACFCPHGFANFVDTPLETLIDKEVPIAELFGRPTEIDLEQQIIEASDTGQRIVLIETFLLNKLQEETTIDSIVKSTVDALLLTHGRASIHTILKDSLSKRRQLERNFRKQIGLSPKQLGKAIRLQAALKMLLNTASPSLTSIAYENEYFDQAHFTKDFKEFVGVTPKEFLGNENLALSALLYK